MSEYIEVPFEGKASEKATLLLAAAEELGLGAGVVRTVTGGFSVPVEVEKQAFTPREVSTGNSEEEKPAKRAAKKSTTKKAQE